MSGSDQWQIKAKYRARRGCVSVGRAHEEGARSACPQHLPFLSSYLREQLGVLAGRTLAWQPPPRARHRAPRWWLCRARAATCQQLRGASALQVWPRVQAAAPGSWRAPAAACGQRCAEGAASPGAGLPGAAATHAASSLAQAEAGCAVTRAQGWFYPSQPCSGLGCCALWSLGFGKGEPRGWDPGGSTHLAPPQRTGTPLPWMWRLITFRRPNEAGITPKGP